MPEGKILLEYVGHGSKLLDFFKQDVVEATIEVAIDEFNWRESVENRIKWGCYQSTIWSSKLLQMILQPHQWLSDSYEEALLGALAEDIWQWLIKALPPKMPTWCKSKGDTSNFAEFIQSSGEYTDVAQE